MNILPNDDKIKKYLDELADEYKELLYKALVSRTKSLDELSVSELLRLDNEIKKPLHEDYLRQQRKRRLLFAVGLTYMFIGFFIFVLFGIAKSKFEYNIDDSVGLLMGIIVGLTGLFACIVSFALPTLNLFSGKYKSKQKEESLALLKYEVVAKWRELEGLTNDISINTNVKTTRSIISYLADNQFIDEEEHKLLKDFLRMRNNIVHSTDCEYSADEIIEMLDKINKVIAKITKIV